MSAKPPPPLPRRRVTDEHSVSALRTIPERPPEQVPERVSSQKSALPRLRDFEHFVRIDKQGRVLTGHGELEDLAALCAYSCRIADVIGELLDFGPSSAVEATFAHGSVFAYRDGAGEVVGIKPHARVSLRDIRARLKL